MLRALTATVAVLVLAAGGCQPQPKHHEEDDPGWNCHTDGNKKCGPSNPKKL